jgi:hypothetical protein
MEQDLCKFLAKITLKEDFASVMAGPSSKKKLEYIEEFHTHCRNPEFMQHLANFISVLHYFLSNFIRFHSAGVKDVLDGKLVSETDEVERTKCLHKFLRASPVSLEKIEYRSDADDGVTNVPVNVIIEHQPSKIGMKTNNKSTMVGHQLLFYYVNIGVNGPILISPKLKNNISLDEGLRYEGFLAAQTRRNHKDAVYAARKQHSKESMLHLLKVFNQEHILEGVPKSCFDDLADSIMQVIAYLVENKIFS